MKIFRPDASGRFLSRINRFVTEVECDESAQFALSQGQRLRVHCPNPGRLQELYIPGKRVLLQFAGDTGRKYLWTLAAMEHHDNWVPMVSASANRAAAELVLPRIFSEMTDLRSEVSIGKHRFDHLVDIGGTEVIVEVKSCSLVEKRLAMFPDAPSERAVSHLESLSQFAEQTMLLFIVNHGSAEYLSANYHNDPHFARALKQAADRGVDIQAHRITVNANGEAAYAGKIEVLYSEVWESGAVLSFENRDGQWLLDVTFAKKNFSKLLSAAEKKNSSVKNIIPFRCADPDSIREELTAFFSTSQPGHSCRQLHDEPAGMRWAVGYPNGEHPLLWRELNECIFSLRHRISLRDLTE